MIRLILFCAFVALLGLGCVTAGATADPAGAAPAPAPLTTEQLVEQADAQAKDALARKVQALESLLVKAREALNGAREAAVNAATSAAACTAPKGGGK